MAFTANQREFNRGKEKDTLDMNTEVAGFLPNTSGELEENAVLFDLLDPKHAENKTLHNLRNILTRLKTFSHSNLKRRQ